MSYPTALAVVNKGTIPRKIEHRENLRRFLELDERTWAEILLQASGIEEIAEESPTGTLQLLVAREMFGQGLSEQALAKASGVPATTITNLIRKGTIPRRKALDKLADTLSIDHDQLERAVESAHLQRRRLDPQQMQTGTAARTQGLAQLVARHICERNLSIAGFARRVGIGYLTLSRFLTCGHPPEDDELLGTLRGELDVDEETFTESLERGRKSPEPASVSVRADGLPADANPLQIELIKYMRKHKLTIKSLSKSTGLSQITVSRLIKQGAMPRRSRTHEALMGLLDLEREDYEDLIGIPTRTTQQKRRRKTRSARHESDAGDSQSYPMTSASAGFGPDAALTALPENLDDELLVLMSKLDESQQKTLKEFLYALIEGE